MLDRAALRVGRGVIEPAQPRVADRAGAHRARLERDVEIAVGQPVLAELARAAGAERDHFGVGGRVGVAARAIAGAGDHLAVARQRRADRRLAAASAARASAKATLIGSS